MWASIRRGSSSLSNGKRTTYYALAIIQGDREEAFWGGVLQIVRAPEQQSCWRRLIWLAYLLRRCEGVTGCSRARGLRRERKTWEIRKGNGTRSGRARAKTRGGCNADNW